MKYQAGDLLRYESNITVTKRMMYCVVLKAEKDSGTVFWLHGSDKQFQQVVYWKSYYGIFERLS